MVTRLKPEPGMRLSTICRHLNPPIRLAPKESLILVLAAEQGKTYREIARIVGTAESTVKNQMSSVLAKLGASNRTHAVYKYFVLGEGK
jgi:DNA-binding NarL/FixJ family response regulator